MRRTSAIGERPRAGFTLVELLLVLTIISLAAAAVVIAMPDGRPSLQREAERLAARISMARDAAIVENRPMAVEIAGAGYRFAERRGGAWQALSRAPFAQTNWEEDTRVRLSDGAAARATFDPTGLSDPLTLTLERGGEARTVRLDLAGNVAVAAE